MAEANIIEIDGALYRYNAANKVYEKVVLVQPTSSNSDAVIENNEEPDVLKKNVWNHTQTLLLLEQYKERRDDFTNPRYKKFEIHKDIAKVMSKHGHNFSPEQVNNRLKTLISKYKSIKDHNSTSGNNPKSFEYLDIMEDCCSERPGITATAACSSIAANNMTSQISVKITESETGSCSSVSDSGSPKRKITRKSSPRVEMLKFLKDYRKDSQEREKKRLELAEKQHQETQQLLQQLLNLTKNTGKREQ